MTTNRYIKFIALFTLLLLSIIAGLNYFVNPYLIFDVPRIKGLNAQKADISNYIRQSKSYHPLYQNIDTLLVGNSRIEMGLNPEHSCFSEFTYNLGIPGASVEMQTAFALNILRQKPSITNVVMSLDFTDFIHDKKLLTPSEFNFSGQSSLRYFIDGRSNESYWFQSLKDRYMALLSLDATISSIKTVILQNATAANRTEKGFNPAFEVESSTQIEGPFQVFEHTLGMLDTILYEKIYPSTPFSENINYLALQELINFTQAHSIKLTFFVNPLHTSFYTAIDKAELTDDLTRWNLDINEFFLQNELAEHFYDFGMIIGKTDESYPSSSRTEPLSWFWEPAHYNQKLGNELIEMMAQRICSSS